MIIVRFYNLLNVNETGENKGEKLNLETALSSGFLVIWKKGNKRDKLSFKIFLKKSILLCVQGKLCSSRIDGQKVITWKEKSLPF